MMPESKNFDNNLSLSIYYASFQLKKKFLPGQRFCPRQIATVKNKFHSANGVTNANCTFFGFFSTTRHTACHTYLWVF